MAEKRIIRKSAAPVSKRVAAPVVEDDDEDERPTMGNGTYVPPERVETEIRGGWGAAQETIDSTSQYAQNLRIETKTQIVKFLDGGKPYASFRRHWIDRVGIGRRPYVCLQTLGKDCPLCDVGQKPGAVTAFNVALLSDDGVASVKSWDCGVKVTQQLRTYDADPKIGPLGKRNLYFAVSKTETPQRQQATTIVNPVRERDLLEDWGTPPIDDAQLARLQTNCYTADIVTMHKYSELEEIALEITGEDAPQQRPWGS